VIQRPRGAIPVIHQLEMADCSAACLAMTLAYHRRRVPLAEIRDRIAAAGRGATASAILRAAESYGLRGRGVRLEPEALHHLARGSILHWSFQHFVVYEGVARAGVRIVDPAVGRRVVPHDTFDKSFTGVALQLEPGPDFVPGGRTARGLGKYLRPLMRRRGVIARVVVISFLVQVFGLGLPLLTGAVVDRVVPDRDLGLLGVLSVGMLGLVLAHAMASLIRSQLLLFQRIALDAELSMGFMFHLVGLPYGYFLRRSVGDLLMRYQSNGHIRETLTSATLSTLLDGTMVVLYVVLLLAISPLMGLLAIALGAAQVTLFWFSRGRYRELVAEELEAQSRAQTQLVGILEGIETLKASGSERESVTRWSHRLAEWLNVAIARGRLAAVVDASRLGLDLTAPLAILIAGGYQVVQGRMTLGLMLAMNALAVGFLRPLSSLVSTALELQQMTSHVERVEDVLTAEPEQNLDTGVRVTLRGAIRVDRVGFRYDRGGPNVLRDTRSRSARARRRRWSGDPGPASRRWRVCWSAFTGRPRARSHTTVTISRS
jgi:ABC-type bacteriocin/lantibiotic exporter with double-glycine peptidase domain